MSKKLKAGPLESMVLIARLGPIASQGDDPAGAVLGFNLVNPPNAFLYSNEREEN